MDEEINRRKIIKNFFWSFGERIGAQGVSLVVSIIIARLVEPDVFGIVALMMVAINILQVFVDSGFGTALIQKKDADDLDFSTVFYFNLVICCILYTLVFFTAPLLASFFNIPELSNYIRVLGISIILFGIKNIIYAFVAKNLMFKKFFFSTLSGTIVAAVVGIVMAYNGYGVWSLVFQHLSNVIIDTLVLWITVGWRPIRSFSIKKLKNLYNFAWKILLANFMECSYVEIINIFVGKVYTVNDLAFYNRGETFPKILVSNVNSAIDSVLFPVLSDKQGKSEEIKKIARQSIKMSFFIMTPIMIGLAVIAPQLIRVLLTEKWLPSVPYLRIFCIIYLFYPIHTANLNAIKAVGRSDLFLKLEIYKILCGGAILIISIQFGVLYMALGMVLSSILCQMINAFPNKKLIKYSYLDQLKDILPYILASIIMGFSVFLVSLLNIGIYGKLLIQIVVGFLVYFGISYFFKFDMIKNIRFLIKKNRN